MCRVVDTDLIAGSAAVQSYLVCSGYFTCCWNLSEQVLFCSTGLS